MGLLEDGIHVFILTVKVKTRNVFLGSLIPFDLVMFLNANTPL